MAVLLKPDKTTLCNGVTVNEFLLTTKKNNPNGIALPGKRTKKLLGITVHNTEDLENVHDDAEQYTRATYNGNMKDVRVHFYVDDVCAWQNLPLDQVGWHAADGNGNGNEATIAIECIMTGQDQTADRKARDNCARLVAWLLDKYGLNPDTDIYTHVYWMNVRDNVKGTKAQLMTKKHPAKTCPAYLIPKWSDFVKLCKSYTKAGSQTVTNADEQIIYRVQVGAYSVKSNADALLAKLKKAGFSGYITAVKIKKKG